MHMCLQSRHFGLGYTASSVANAQLGGALFGVRVGHLTQTHFDFALQCVLVRVREQIQYNLQSYYEKKETTCI